MRTTVVLGILLTLFIAFGLYVQHYIVRTSDVLVRHTKAVLDAAHQKKWDEAKQYVHTLTDAWHRIGKHWNLVTEHQEIDDINGTLSRFQAYIQEEELAGALAEGSAAIHLFQHIPQKEALSIANIL